MGHTQFGKKILWFWRVPLASLPYSVHHECVHSLICGAHSHFWCSGSERVRKKKEEFMHWKFSDFYCHFFRLPTNTQSWNGIISRATSLYTFIYSFHGTTLWMEPPPPPLLLPFAEHYFVCKHKNIGIDISQVNKFQMRCHTATRDFFFLDFLSLFHTQSLSPISHFWFQAFCCFILLSFWLPTAAMMMLMMMRRSRALMIFRQKIGCEKFSLFSTSMHSIWFVHFYFYVEMQLRDDAASVLVPARSLFNGARHLTSSFSVGIVWFYEKSRTFFHYFHVFLFLLQFCYECEIDFVVKKIFFFHIIIVVISFESFA